MDKEYFKFLKNAYETGLCDEYRDLIRSCREDKLEIMRLAMRQQSIPYVAEKMRQGVIKKQYLLKNYGGYLNGYVLHDCDDVPNYTYSWFVDYDYVNDLEVTTDVAHISYTKKTTVIVPETKCPTLYISNKSDVSLVCEGYNTVKVYMFDNSRLIVEDTDTETDLIIYEYSDSCEVTNGKFCLGKVKTFRKELRI